MASLQKPRKAHMLHLLVTLSLTLLILPNRAEETTSSTDPAYYYNLCTPSTCNNLLLTYPFILPSLCHPSTLKPTCTNDGSLLYTSSLSIHTFRIVSPNFTTDPTTTYFHIVDNSLFGCGSVSKPDYASDTYFFTVPFNSTPGTHLNCTRSIPASAIQGIQPASCLGCTGQDLTNVCYYAPGFVSYPDCEKIYVFTPRSFNVSDEKDLRAYLRRGFQMSYTKPIECSGCEASGGRCGTSPSSGSHVCFCPSRVHRFNCSDGIIVDITTWTREAGGRNSESFKTLIAGIAMGSGLMVFICICYIFCNRRHRQKHSVFTGQDEQALRRYLEGDNTTPASIEVFLHNYTLGKPTRFSYKQLKRYTKNFTHKLGQGGYSSVFKGELPKGFFIAVKLLDQANQSEVQFLDEIRTIGKIHHNHLVRLLGYCFEHSRQALVYEFMENGSLDKYIHAENQDLVKKLTWSQLHNIAVGTARGIAYLHEECRIRILHCDIKPHNILLDDKFWPKVSDFGLAQALQTEYSHVSITHGVGTLGYAPPEMWWMNYGPVTEKSDAYSFGIVVLEMVGKRRNFVNDAISNSTEAYFPEWVYLHHAINANCSGGISTIGEEEETARRMDLVGLWCIQFQPSQRPSMRRVIEMLEGNVVIEIPPAPFTPAAFFTSDCKSGVPLLPQLGSLRFDRIPELNESSSS